MSRVRLWSFLILLPFVAGISAGAWLEKSRLIGTGKLAGPPGQEGAGRDKAITVYAGTPQAVDEATLFAFDNLSIPFHRNLYLTMHPAQKDPGNPVLKREKGKPDESRAQYLGTVLRHEGKFKMWYIASDDESFESHKNRTISGFRLAYAESQDGIRWTKPNLGLVDYRGTRNNNLVLVEPSPLDVIAAVSVLYEPDDPDPSRRFKMMAATPAEKTGSTSVPLYSGDGLHWRLAIGGKPISKREGKWMANRIPVDRLPLGEFLEQGGLYKWNGMYHIAGQQHTPWIWLPDGQPCGRVMAIFRSSNFVHWSDTKSLGFVRYGYRSVPVNEGEESHEPASIWNRGNVLLGTFGLFHGSPGGAFHPLDLGLLLSNDGNHFREALPDFALVPRGQAGSWDSLGILQGQGFENVEDRTYVWYGGWDNDVTRPDVHAEIGLVTLRRDGFGSLSPKNPSAPAAFVTCPLKVNGAGRIWINGEGLSQDAGLRVELLDETERPLAEYSGESSTVLRQAGLRVPVFWKHKTQISGLRTAFRIRVRFEGEQRRAIKLYAVYVTQ